MKYKPSHITLNGELVSIAELFDNTPSVNEKELVAFLKDWYANNDFIEVQTSGSTGQAKTIQLKKDFIAASAKRTIRFFQLKPKDQILHCLPIKYIAGKLMVVRALIGELDLHIVEPSSDFKLQKEQRFKFAAMVPNQILKLLKLSQKNWYIEQLLIGGDAISADLEQQLQQIDTACYSSYGMTETATHIAIRKLNGNKADNYYHCLDKISVQLSNNNCLEICMPTIETLRTTDIAKLKDERTFKILGRSDNIIISGGIKFSPEEIEKKLAAHLKVPFMISYLPHDKLGKQLVLLIESEKNLNLKQELENICQNLLNKFECPRQIKFTNNLPKTDNGKLKRK